MNKNEIDSLRRYESADEFFRLNGSILMRLTTSAAEAVCEQAARRGLVIYRVEGGIWHPDGFEARIDCIWDGEFPPIDYHEAEANNLRAATFISSERGVHDVFVLSAKAFGEEMTVR